jgi:hypothetical protein
MNHPKTRINRHDVHVGGRAQNPIKWLGLSVLAAGVVGGLLIARRRTGKPRMADADTWRQALTEKHGAIKAAVLIDKVQQRYEELYRTRPHYDHPALRMHLEQNILPGLALYQVLQAEKNDQAAALAEVERLLQASAVQSGMRKATAALKYLPEPFGLIRLAARAAMSMAFRPPVGKPNGLRTATNALRLTFIVASI